MEEKKNIFGISRGQKKRAGFTEENELLNATSIKMNEAPFDRSESEDDIVEGYDDPVSFKMLCLQNLTLLEKLLIGLVIIFLVIIISLAVGLTRPQVVPVAKYCNSPACVKAAGSLLSSVDWNVDPCDDFYKFACGHWLQTQPIPQGYHHWDRFQELSGQNLYMLSQLIETNLQIGETFEKTRTLYRSCLGATSKQKGEILDQFSTLIEDVGGWSLSRNDTFNDWSFVVALENVQSYGAWPLFKISVEVDERDPTKRNIITIDVGETVLPSDVFIYAHSGQGNVSNSSATVPPAVKDATEMKKIFLDETVHLLTSFGATEADAISKAESMLELEKFIASASAGHNHIHDRSKLYNVMPISMLQYNFSVVSWIDYFRVLGFQVTESTEVVVLHPDYMLKMTHFLREHYNGTEGKMRTLRDYLVISLIRSFKPFFDKSLFEIKETEEDDMEEAWKRCAYYTNKAMGFSTGALYVKGTHSEGSAEKMEKLVAYVKSAFKDYLLNKYWIDRFTRKKAEEKVDAIINKISYPSKILNNTFLDKYYQKLSVIPSDWFSNLVSWRKFLLSNMVADLSSMPDRKSSWLRPPVTESTYYSPTRNDVIFPIAMFNLPFYIPDGPSAVNFGAMGSIIGHEVTHAFDLLGRQYDGQGKLSNWWDDQTTQNFMLTTPCMRDQYNNIRVNGLKVDGNLTLDENIADNGGLRAAVLAYQMWMEEFGEELQLPGVNLSMYQVFYTSYAQMYCSKWTDHGLFYHILTDPHSPGSARVNGALSNSQTFNWAFKCPLDSPMNPRVRCEVW
ncbi:hypothetical protein BsWGS_04669 [Bradybaena similaris]